MVEFLTLLHLFLVRPHQALMRLQEHVPWWWPGVVVVAAHLLGRAIDLVTRPEPTSVVLFRPGGQVPAAAVIGMDLAASIVFWFLSAAVWHLLARFLGGRGEGRTLFFAVGFAQLPLLVGYSGGGLLRLVGWEAGWTICLILAGLWTVWLEYLSVRVVEGLSGARAVAVMVLPLIAPLCLVLAGLAFLMPLMLYLTMR